MVISWPGLMFSSAKTAALGTENSPRTGITIAFGEQL